MRLPDGVHDVADGAVAVAVVDAVRFDKITSTTRPQMARLQKIVIKTKIHNTEHNVSE